MQPRLDQPRRVRRRRRDGELAFDFEQLGEVVRHGRAVPRPGDRHQLLPDRRGRALQPQLAPGRPRRHGPAGRVLQDCACRSTPPTPGTCRSGSRRRSTSTRCGRPPSSPRPNGPARGLRRDPRRAGQAAVRPVGRHARPTTGSLGRRCATASPSTACATRCSSPSPRPRRSPRSSAATSASSRRCRTCSSARRSRASSCRSTATSCRPAGPGLWNEEMHRRHQAGRGLDPGHRRASRTSSRSSTAPRGRCRCAR